MTVSKQAQDEKKTADHAGYIRRETAYLAILLALITGLVLGSMVPEMLGPKPKIMLAKPRQEPVQNNNKPTDQHLAELEMACAKEPQKQSLWLELANAYYDSNLAHQAIKAYETAQSLGPLTADAICDLGNMYRLTGNFDKAIELYRKAQNLKPDHLQSRLNEGIVLYYDLSRKKAALEVWQRLVETNPEARFPDGTPLKSVLEKFKTQD